jgi:uncharacterized membrane protein
MSKRSFVDPLIRVACAFVALMLLDPPAEAHKAHEQKPVPPPVAEAPAGEEPPARAGSETPAQAHGGHEAHEPTHVSSSVAEAPAGDESPARGISEAPVVPKSVESPEKSASVLSWIGRFHPMVVHFPIALFISALVAEILFATTRRELFRHALRFLLWGGALGAAVAVALGWIFAATGSTEHGWLLDVHRWAGTAASVVGLVVLSVNERIERGMGTRAGLRVSLAAIAVLVGAAGFLGGSLLYGIDHLAWPPQ